MKETGILMTPENHRRILSGDKTQTRRVANFPSWVTGVDQVGEWWHGNGYHPQGECENQKCSHIGGMCGDSTTVGPSMFTLKCSYGVPGDRLYIREGVIIETVTNKLVGYYMDGCRATQPHHERRTAMFMPKSAARTWLEITDVRVQRVQEISEEDSKAEGIDERHKAGFPYKNDPCTICGKNRDAHVGVFLACFAGYGTIYDPRTYRGGFAALWDSINKKTHPWSSNPWCWSLTFKRIQNLDSNTQPQK